MRRRVSTGKSASSSRLSTPATSADDRDAATSATGQQVLDRIVELSSDARVRDGTPQHDLCGCHLRPPTMEPGLSDPILASDPHLLLIEEARRGLLRTDVIGIIQTDRSVWEVLISEQGACTCLGWLPPRRSNDVSS